MKILIIDYRSVKSHQNFNKIHIDVLLNLGHDLTLIGRKGQFDNIEVMHNVRILTVPECFYFSFPFSQLSGRIREIFCLFWILLNLKFDVFDFIIIPTYDILSFFLFRIPNNVVIINHNNVSQLENRLKLTLTKLLPHRFIHIALNELMEERLRKLLPTKVIYHIPHGVLARPIETKQPIFLANVKSFLLCPVNRNVDYSFIQDIFCSAELEDYLEQTGIRLFIKDSLGIHPRSPYIITLPSLSDSEYNYMIAHAKVVILPYSDRFRYRCSGILFECVNYDTPILATKLDDMLLYKNIINIDYFDEPHSLVSGLIKLQNNSSTKKNNAEFTPELYWKKMINMEFLSIPRSQ